METQAPAKAIIPDLTDASVWLGWLGQAGVLAILVSMLWIGIAGTASAALVRIVSTDGERQACVIGRRIDARPNESIVREVFSSKDITICYSPINTDKRPRNRKAFLFGDRQWSSEVPISVCYIGGRKNCSRSFCNAAQICRWITVDLKTNVWAIDDLAIVSDVVGGRRPIIPDIDVAPRNPGLSARKRLINNDGVYYRDVSPQLGASSLALLSGQQKQTSGEDSKKGRGSCFNGGREVFESCVKSGQRIAVGLVVGVVLGMGWLVLLFVRKPIKRHEGHRDQW